MDTKLLKFNKGLLLGVSAFWTVLPAYASQCVVQNPDYFQIPMNSSQTGVSSFIDAPAAPVGAPITVYGTQLQGPLVVGGVSLTDCPFVDETVFEEPQSGIRLAKTTCWLNDVPLGQTTVQAGTGENIELLIYDGKVETIDSFAAFKSAMSDPQPGNFYLLRGFTADLSASGPTNGGQHILWMRDGEHMAPPERPIALIGYPGDPALMKVDGLANGNRAFGFENDGWIVSNLDFETYWNSIMAKGEVRVVGNRVHGLTGVQTRSGTGSVLLGGYRKGSLFAGNIVSGGRTNWRFDHAVYISDCPTERGWKVSWNHIVDNDFARGPQVVVNHQYPRCGKELENKSVASHEISFNVIDTSRYRGRCIGVASFGWEPDFNSTAPGMTTINDNTLINCGYLGDDLDQFGDGRIGAAIYTSVGNSVIERNLLISPQRGIQLGSTSTHARPTGFLPTIVKDNRLINLTGQSLVLLLHDDLLPLVTETGNSVE